MTYLVLVELYLSGKLDKELRFSLKGTRDTVLEEVNRAYSGYGAEFGDMKVSLYHSREPRIDEEDVVHEFNWSQKEAEDYSHYSGDYSSI